MRREGQGRRLAAELARPHQGCADYGTMPAMYAIEVADRHHCTRQRSAVDTLRTAAYNMELSYRRTRSAHCVSGRLEEIVVENVRILSLIGRTFLTAATLSAPITNLQINGLFKARCYFWAPLWGAVAGHMHDGCRSEQARGRLKTKSTPNSGRTNPRTGGQSITTLIPASL